MNGPWHKIGEKAFFGMAGNSTAVCRAPRSEAHSTTRRPSDCSEVSPNISRYLHMHVCMYVVIDLKVLVRSFNCESRACYVGNPRESFFRVRESKILFRESFAKVGYYNHYM